MALEETVLRQQQDTSEVRVLPEQAHEQAVRLNEANERLAAVIARLEDRLHFALDPSERVSGLLPDRDAVCSPLASLLGNQAAAVEQAIGRIQSVIDRVDLPSNA